MLDLASSLGSRVRGADPINEHTISPAFAVKISDEIVNEPESIHRKPFPIPKCATALQGLSESFGKEAGRYNQRSEPIATNLSRRCDPHRVLVRS
ncbi:hypothetical protein AcW1_009819 [Taiwanofungus camphoratus]|nr:hypothetical protein AcW1_009819 [Antrodia cinnamomea]